MSDALITAAAALIGALGGAWLGRIWAWGDLVRARRRDWAVQVMKFLDAVSDVGAMVRVKSDEAPKPSTELEVDDATVLTIYEWVKMRSYQYLWEEAKAQKNVEQHRMEADYSTLMIPANRYHHATRIIFGRWARADLRSRFHRYEHEIQKTPQFEAEYF